MRNSKGDLSSISKTLKRYARHGDIAGLRTYGASEAFLEAFVGLEPKCRLTVMAGYVEARAICEAKANLPLAAPIALNARASAKLANWRDRAMQTRLAEAYAGTQDHEGAARILGVTLGAARLAKRRYLDRAATSNPAKGP
jgi:hypothetical protein